MNEQNTIQVLQQISKSISETLDLKAILHQIVDGARSSSTRIGSNPSLDEAKEIIIDSYESPQGSGISPHGLAREEG